VTPPPQKGKVLAQVPSGGTVHCSADVFVTITVGA
jgi:hypothetical protein